MALDDDIMILETAPMLRLLGRQALRIIAIGAESQYVHGGEVLFRAGEPAEAGFVVQEGSFNLSIKNAAGSDSVAGRGTLLGETALITATTRTFTAIAIEPSTVVRISRNLFMKMLESYPDAARRLRDYIAARTDQTVKEMQKVRSALESRGRS
jgi:CRP-like cAMP-binding protein